MKANLIRRKGVTVGVRVKEIYNEGQLEMFERCVEDCGVDPKTVEVKDMGGAHREIRLNETQLEKFINSWN